MTSIISFRLESITKLATKSLSKLNLQKTYRIMQTLYHQRLGFNHWISPIKFLLQYITLKYQHFPLGAFIVTFAWMLLQTTLIW